MDIPTIVYAYAQLTWHPEGDPGRQVMLMTALSQIARVVMLETGRASARGCGWAAPRLHRESGSLYVVHNAFRLRSSRLGRLFPKLTARIDGALLGRELRQHGVRDYVYWLGSSSPDLLPWMNTERLVYDCIDPCFEPDHQAMFDRDEAQLAARARLVFCTAQELADRMRPHNRNVYLLPNACAPSLITGADATTPRPNSLAARPGPVIGYLGTLDWRVDFAMLEAAARQLPAYTFALVGRLNRDQLERAAGLSGLPNVVMPGRVPTAETGVYMNAFDVGLIPFLRGTMGDSINPVKMYMYLAAGKPVVATDIRECRDMSPLVRTAASADEFAAAISDAANDRSGASQASRRTFAEANTWKHRAETALAVLAEHGLLC